MRAGARLFFASLFDHRFRVEQHDVALFESVSNFKDLVVGRADGQGMAFKLVRTIDDPSVELATLLDDATHWHGEHVAQIGDEHFDLRSHGGLQAVGLAADFHDRGILLEIGVHPTAWFRLVGDRDDSALELTVADLHVGRHANFQPLDLAFMHGHLDLHVAEVRQPQDRLRFADGRPFLDLHTRLRTHSTAAPLIVRIDHDAVLRSLDLAITSLSLQACFLGLFQIEGRLLGGHQRPSGFTLGFELLQHLLPRKLFEHIFGGPGRLKFELRPFDGELVRFDLQRSREAFARHLPRMFEQVFRTAEIFLSDADVRFGGLQIFDECSFGIFLDRDFSGTVVFFGLNLGSLRLAEIDLLGVELILDRRVVQSDQQRTSLDFGPFGHDPQNRSATGDLAFHVNVLGALHVARRDHGDQQPSFRNRVRQRSTGIHGGTAIRLRVTQSALAIHLPAEQSQCREQ